MQTLRQFGSSILLGTLSLLLLVGGLTTSLAEKNIDEPFSSITETSLPTRDATDIPTATVTPVSPGLLPTATGISSPSPTATIPPSTSCPAPTGWYAYIVQVGDTLASLAARYNTTTNALKEANCLVGNSLIPDTRIYVPSVAPTSTPIPCGPPYGWVKYTVQRGDNLYRISLAYRVTVAALQNANCMGYSTKIKAGEQIYVPNVPTSTPVATNTATATKTGTPTSTSNAPTASPTASPTQELPTATATATSSPTATNTATSLPSPTYTFTPES